MGPYQRTPKEVARAIRFSGLGVRSVGPVGDFLDYSFLFLSQVVVRRIFEPSTCPGKFRSDKGVLEFHYM